MNFRAVRLPFRVAALVLCALLGVAGCSDADGNEDAGENEVQSEVAANARASAINVGLSDLPEEFVAIPAPQDGEGEEEPAAVEGCVGQIEDVTVADAASPTFRLSSDASLSFLTSETSIISDPDAGDELLDAVQEQPVLDCLSDRLGEVFAELLPGATTAIPLALTPDTDFPELAGRTVRLAGEATFIREGAPEPITVSTSLVLLQTGDALSVLLFGGLPEPFAAETLRSVATAVADRQADQAA